MPVSIGYFARASSMRRLVNRTLRDAPLSALRNIRRSIISSSFERPRRVMATFLTIVVLAIESRRAPFLLQTSCQKEMIQFVWRLPSQVVLVSQDSRSEEIKSRAAHDESVTDSQHWQSFVATAVASNLSRA